MKKWLKTVVYFLQQKVIEAWAETRTMPRWYVLFMVAYTLLLVLCAVNNMVVAATLLMLAPWVWVIVGIVLLDGVLHEWLCENWGRARRRAGLV